MTKNQAIQAAREAYGADPLQQTRKQPNVWARAACYATLYEPRVYTVQRLGKEFGVDHSTVVYSLKVHRQFLECDKEYQKKYNEFTETLRKIVNPTAAEARK